MEPTDITIEILKSIREELRGTRTELSEELRGTNARLDGLEFGLREGLSTVKEGISALSRRVVESEVRTATAITDMHGTLRDVRDLLREQLDLRPRLERCERDIGELRQQILER